MIRDILSALSALTGISVGQLETGNSTAMELAPSAGGDRDLAGMTDDTLSLLILSKHKKQASCIEALDCAVNQLTRTRVFPSGDHWSIYAADVATQPNYVTKDGDYWIYSCVISVNYINKEVITNA